MNEKYWIQDGAEYRLYFTPFGEDELIATLFYDEGWCVKGKFPHDWLEADTLEEAKREVEYLIESHYESEAEHFAYLLKAFREAVIAS